VIASIGSGFASAIIRWKMRAHFRQIDGREVHAMRFDGRARPMAFSEARIRSRDSATTRLGSPTTGKAGRPEDSVH
jgi:hypothetical protein